MSMCKNTHPENRKDAKPVFFHLFIYVNRRPEPSTPGENRTQCGAFFSKFAGQAGQKDAWDS